MKKITAVIIAVSISLNIAGCAGLPPDKYLNRLSDEEREEVQKGVEFNRSMWQLGSFGLGALAGCGDSSPRNTGDIVLTTAAGSLAMLGIASLCNLHTYRENDTEKDALFTGLIAGGVIGGAFSIYLSAQSLAQPNEFMFLPLLLSPLIIAASSLTGGGLGVIWANIEKLFTGSDEI